MDGHQRHMPDAGSFSKQVPQEDTANLLAKQNLHERTGMQPISLSRLNVADGNRSDTSAESR